jgi:hypothetical protein
MSRASFDALAVRLAESSTTFSERELLQPTHWSLGEDARLREDQRFRETTWGRWMLAEDLIANDAIDRWLRAERRSAMPLEAALRRAFDLFGRRCVFCPDDPRFVLHHDEVHLSASQLSRQPVIEDEVGDLERYATHLPLHSLKAAAASEPAGQWGPRAQEQVIETLGWVRVSLPGRRLNDRMFIAEVEGHSMNDGRSGLVDGGYAVFELWPSGSRQHLNVLVRGAFRDPETGSYAVKKFVADKRDADGRHHWVSLVSLNPDKERYPDIELAAEDDELLTVVAKVVQALSTGDYERRPKPLRRVGRRTLGGHEGLDEQATSLGRRVASFFDPALPRVEDEEENEVAGDGWHSRLVCMEVEDGGLHIEVGPLDGLPPFARKLRVAGEAGWDALVLAANARVRPVRVAVRPATGPWRWEVLGFADEQDLGMARLGLDALDASVPVVFRVDAERVGRRLKSSAVALGQAYRLLLPPGVGEASLGMEIDQGWRLWSIELAGEVSATTRQALAALGLEAGEAWPRLEWALFPATAWRTNARGEAYPVFDVGDEVLVSVDGTSAGDGDTVMLFLHGPTGTERLEVSADGVVSLGTLTPGRWACALLHPRTRVPNTTLVFEVAEHAARFVAAHCDVAAPAGLASLEASAPAGWPVALRWSALHEDLLTTLHAGDDGAVDLDDVRASIEARSRRTRIADLVVDFGELGRRSIGHDARASVEEVREALNALWQQRSGLVRSRAGAWITLLPTWFEPVTALFGYGIEPFADGVLPATEADAPHGLAAWRLTIDERVMGAITRSPSRVLVLTTDLDAVLGTARDWLDRACSAAQLRDALVTDGVRWTTYRRGNRLSRGVWDLGASVVDRRALESMLAELGEGL